MPNKTLIFDLITGILIKSVKLRKIKIPRLKK